MLAHFNALWLVLKCSRDKIRFSSAVMFQTTLTCQMVHFEILFVFCVSFMCCLAAVYV